MIDDTARIKYRQGQEQDRQLSIIGVEGRTDVSIACPLFGIPPPCWTLRNAVLPSPNASQERTLPKRVTQSTQASTTTKRRWRVMESRSLIRYPIGVRMHRRIQRARTMMDQ